MADRIMSEDGTHGVADGANTPARKAEGWEKTVIKEDRIMKMLLKGITTLQIAEAQAEKTWHSRDKEIEQTRQEGRREVVEWLEKKFGYFIGKTLAKIIIDDGGYFGRKGSVLDYLNQKKEWRIE